MYLYVPLCPIFFGCSKTVKGSLLRHRKNLVTESDGALCVFTNVSETPLIIQKADGGHSDPFGRLLQHDMQKVNDMSRLPTPIDTC